MKRLVVFLIIYSIMFFPNFLPGNEHKAKSVLAVLDLTGKNVTKSDASIITGFIQESLFKIDNYELVERTQVEKILKEQAFQADVCDINCAIQIGKQLAANKVVIGTVGRLGDLYTIQVKIIEVESNKIERIESIRAKCNIGELPDYIENLVQKLVGSIALLKNNDIKVESKEDGKKPLITEKTIEKKIDLKNEDIKQKKNIIEKPGLKKKKKKFPVLLVVGGSIIVGLLVAILSKKKETQISDEDLFAPFRLSASKYSEKQDIESITQELYGTNASIADWETLKSLIGNDEEKIYKFYQYTGLKDLEAAMVSNLGNVFLIVIVNISSKDLKMGHIVNFWLMIILVPCI